MIDCINIGHGGGCKSVIRPVCPIRSIWKSARDSKSLSPVQKTFLQIYNLLQSATGYYNLPALRGDGQNHGCLFNADFPAGAIQGNSRVFNAIQRFRERKKILIFL